MGPRDNGQNAASTLQFVNYTHPEQARDRKAKKKVFSHAMRHYLRRDGTKRTRSIKGTWRPLSRDDPESLPRDPVMILRPTSVDDAQVYNDQREQQRNPVRQQTGAAMQIGFSKRTLSTTQQPIVNVDHESRHSSSPFILKQAFLRAVQASSTIDADSVSNDTSLDTMDTMPLSKAEPSARFLRLYALDIQQADLPSLHAHRLGGLELFQRGHNAGALMHQPSVSLLSLLALLRLTDILLELPSSTNLSLAPVELTTDPYTILSPFNQNVEAQRRLRESSMLTGQSLTLLYDLGELASLFTQAEDMVSSISTNPPSIARSLLSTHVLLKQPRATSQSPSTTLHQLITRVATLFLVSISKHIKLSAVAAPSSDLVGCDILEEIAILLESIHAEGLIRRTELSGVFLFLALILLPATRPEEDLDDDINAGEEHPHMHCLREFAVEMIQMVENDMARLFLESTRCILRIQEWLGRDVDAITLRSNG